MQIDSQENKSSKVEIDKPEPNKRDFNKIYSISMALIQLISENHSKPTYKTKLKEQKKSNFNSRMLPRISLSDYIDRIHKYTKIEDSTLTLGLIYIDRLCKRQKIVLTEYNVHRIIMSSLLISIKYNEDKYYTNIFYAKIGGLDLKQLNLIETEFLIGINFDLFLDNKLFEKYEKTLSFYGINI